MSGRGKGGKGLGKGGAKRHRKVMRDNILGITTLWPTRSTPRERLWLPWTLCTLWRDREEPCTVSAINLVFLNAICSILYLLNTWELHWFVVYLGEVIMFNSKRSTSERIVKSWYCCLAFDVYFGSASLQQEDEFVWKGQWNSRWISK